MFYRRKVILALLEALGGELNRTDFQKHLFIYTQQQPETAYDFVPYQFGCYSFSAEADRAPMMRAGLLSDGDTWRKETRTSYVEMLRPDDRRRLIHHVEHYGRLRGRELVRKVYSDHPFYATRSRIAQDVLHPSEMGAVEAMRVVENRPALLTIGYEGRSLESYLNQLLLHGVTVLCDVRKNPVSRKYGFSKRTLSACTEKIGIRYVHIPELGIPSGRRKGVDSSSDFERLFDEYARDVLPRRGEELRQIAGIVERGGRVALTCFEACHGDCHRSRVSAAVADLPQWNAPLKHL